MCVFGDSHLPKKNLVDVSYQIKQNQKGLSLYDIRRQRRTLERFILTLYLKAANHWRLFLLRNSHFREWLVCPMNYWRSVELPIVLKLLSPIRDERILDVGSPKLLSLFLSFRTRARIFATDLRDYFLDDFIQFRETFGLYNLKSETCDARKMHYLDNTFDKIFSISVIEHIPETGDIDALREFSRVTKPGGQVVITIPYNRNSITEYTKESHYWIKKSDKASFYQRRYSYSSLKNRLTRPAGFKIKNLYFIGERPIKKPCIRSDGTFIHNYFFLNQSPSIKFLRKTHIPYLTYLNYRIYSNLLHYISTDPNDPNVRNVVLDLKKDH